MSVLDQLDAAVAAARTEIEGLHVRIAELEEDLAVTQAEAADAREAFHEATLQGRKLREQLGALRDVSDFALRTAHEHARRAWRLYLAEGGKQAAFERIVAEKIRTAIEAARRHESGVAP